ncbi:hypothetical protein GLW08_05670 [Pontibacillus yanchengensis]|uniref:Uncharacterized protein n=2 Tax=Pontibacillus yanchengensis TaxID=462910 RepID=A0ACC7VFX6_9BACI|nr:hypothetical protein [Pontibacillus yanchengensis]MYL32244.1 hypothetical protein [Pontibacillus yanchengensis]MYL52824.1 hypothetical protein [Pontibacillus yanchengensis]
MNYLVWGCYEGIGFHIVNALLDEGHEVVGIDKRTEKKETLAMFIGRNSNFSYYNTVEDYMKEEDDNAFEEMYVVEHENHSPPWKQLEHIDASSRVRILPYNQLDQGKNGWITVQVERCYGPWLSTPLSTIKKQDIPVEDVISPIFKVAASVVEKDVVTLGMDEGKEHEKYDRTITRTKPFDETIKRAQEHQSQYPSYYEK